MVVFDNNFLTFLFHERPGDVTDPDSGEVVERPQARIQHLVATLRAEGTRILIPSPALAELLTFVESPHPILESIQRASSFEVAAFDTKAAIETALTLRRAREAGDMRGGSDKARASIKFDHQIVGIAKSRGARTLYSSDSHIRRLATHAHIPAVAIWDLELPPPSQDELF